MNLANRKATFSGLSRSIALRSIVSVTFSADQTVSSCSTGGIDHTPRVISKGKISNVGHSDPTLKIRLMLLDLPFQHELAQFKKDLPEFVEVH